MNSPLTPLVIAFTPNYFVQAAVTLRSLLDATDDDQNFEVIVTVSEDLPQELLDMLTRMTGDRIKYRCINMKGALDGYYVDPRYSEAASYRLLLPKLLPEYDKVLYIDCDVVIRQDLAELYHIINLGDNLVAAVYEALIDNQPEAIRARGCDPDHYFNSGFLVMNLKQMREENTVDKLMAGLKVDYLEFPDQDVLNQVCLGRVLPLGPQYNSIRTFFLPAYKADFCRKYGKQKWKDIKFIATIHYTGASKPWFTTTAMFTEWWNVFNRLPREIRRQLPRSLRLRIIVILDQFPPTRKLVLKNIRRISRLLKKNG